MALADVRLFIYLGLTLMFSTGASFVWIARRKIPHALLATACLLLFTLWFLLLALSIRDLHWLPREMLVSSLTAIGAGILATGVAWLALTIRLTFRLMPGHRPTGEHDAQNSG